ncbi:hypothetical protein BDZ45DRAFT_754895 [Acephala macrosclerotiorum]|nr:hypothetical protein BDZ45DRAFT_754895 [Acephala macrosclerotiorum]
MYYTAVMAEKGHPRHAGYTILSAYAESMGIDTLAGQLLSKPSTGVSPEMWQVIADYFHIELLVITGDKRYRMQANLPYRFTPDKSSPYEWRYSSHIITDLVKAPKNEEQLQEFIAQASEPSARRCPYLITDLDGVNVVPHVAIPRYGGPFLPPDHILDECQALAPPTDAQFIKYPSAYLLMLLGRPLPSPLIFEARPVYAPDSQGIIVIPALRPPQYRMPHLIMGLYSQ